MKSYKLMVVGIFLLPLLLQSSHSKQCEVWGFYAHKLINKMAVFTLPGDLIEFYKANLDYIINHAVDPDKRRYALKGEAIRHYIDLDHWSPDGVFAMPKDITSARIRLNHFYLMRGERKLLLFDTLADSKNNSDSLFYGPELIENKMVYGHGIPMQEMKCIFLNVDFPDCHAGECKIPAAFFMELFTDLESEDYIEIEDRLSPHGILPYHLEQVYLQLVDAFKRKSKERILRLSADIGHYVGDAHVPLHTSENYNGQLTNQEGIHAFWESRIPELFAEAEFDFVVGPATYISDIRNFIWKIIEDSHKGVGLVLSIEKSLSQQTPADQQYCYDSRLGAITKIQCRDYAKKYHQLLDNQVEERMRASIIDLGSIWMSAWVEAGQPQLKFDKELKIVEDQVKVDRSDPGNQQIKIRDHE